MIGDVLVEIRDFDPGDWSQSDVAIGANLVRWRPAGVVEEGSTRLWLETSRPDVRGTLVDAPPELAPPGVSVAEINFTIPTDDPLQDVADEMARLFGEPPVIVSGPSLRWYGRSMRTRAELSRGVVAGEIQVRLAQLPWCEDDELSSLRFGSVLSPPYLWRADEQRLLPNGLRIEGGLMVENSGELAYQLPYVLRSFRDGVAQLPRLLPTLMWTIFLADEPTTFVQGFFEPHAYGFDTTGEPENLPATDEALTDMVGRTLGVIESWGVDDPEQLRARVFVNGSSRTVITPGLGLQLS